MNKAGKIGIYFLKDIWTHSHKIKKGDSTAKAVEWNYMNAVFNTLGIGIEPTINFLMNHSTSFNDFEEWIEKNGKVSQDMINYFNAIIEQEEEEAFIPEEEVFSEADLKHWNEEGYVVLKNAISKADCEQTIQLIAAHIDIDLQDKSSWYAPHPLKQGIMIQLFNAEILNNNRLSKRIRLAFQQLWRKKNLIVSMDRVSFNPPETSQYTFQGPNLHWDVSLKQPMIYGLQGLVYLNDIAANQGAFTVIPGFHNILENWLSEIKTNPRKINLLDTFDEKPIAGQAGDLIIWNHYLPHGSRPNHADFPRFVQYINYQPLDLEHHTEWL